MILVPALRVMDRRFLARMVLTGERFDADQAAAAGLLSAVVEDDAGLDAWVAEQTLALRKSAPGAVRATKELLRALPGAGLVRGAGGRRVDLGRALRRTRSDRRHGRLLGEAPSRVGHHTVSTAIRTRLSVASEEFEANASAMAALVDEVRGLHDDVLAGGGARYVERHRARGKMMVRERVEALVDPGTPVLELCAAGRAAHR